MLVWVRAFVLALTVLGVGTVSHVVGDGLLPGPVTLLLLLALTTLAVSRFLAAPAGALRVVVLLVGGQALTHVALSATAGHHGQVGARAAAAPPPDSALLAQTLDGRRVGSLMDQALAPSPGTGTGGEGPLAHVVSHAVAAGPWMLLAHTAAAVVLGLWLALGERALWDLLVLLAVRARRSCSVAAVPALLRTAYAALASLTATRTPRPVPLPPRALRPPDRHHPRAVTRRGPPLLLGS